MIIITITYDCFSDTTKERQIDIHMLTIKSQIKCSCHVNLNLKFIYYPYNLDSTFIKPLNVNYFLNIPLKIIIYER